MLSWPSRARTSSSIAPRRRRCGLRFATSSAEHVDAGDGWLIFALPPAELGVHPSEGSTHHELCLLCDDVAATKAELDAKGVEFRGEPEEMGFGVGLTMVLPGGVEVLLYEPRHPTAV